MIAGFCWRIQRSGRAKSGANARLQLTLKYLYNSLFILIYLLKFRV